MNTSTSPKMLTEAEAAVYIGMSRAFLRIARCQGRLGGRTPGPPFYRIGRAIRYSIADLDAWIEKHRVERAAV